MSLPITSKLEASKLFIGKVVETIEKDGLFVMKNQNIHDTNDLLKNIAHLFWYLGVWLKEHRPGFAKMIMVWDEGISHLGVLF